MGTRHDNYLMLDKIRDGDLKSARLSEKAESLLRKMKMLKILNACKTVDEAIGSFDN